MLNYLGPDNGQGIEVYQDGVWAKGSGDFTSSASRGPGDGHTVIGKRYTGVDGYYSSIIMDELLFFNNKLSAEQVQQIFRNWNNSKNSHYN